MKSFRYYLLATTIIFFFLMVMGNVVRVSDAAGTCPDWPTCFGQFSFPADRLAQLEVIHRGLAALTTLLIGAAVVWAARMRAPGLVRLPLAASLPLMVLQIGLGGGLVFAQQPAVLAALHLGLALAAQALIMVSTTAAFGLAGAGPQTDFSAVLRGEAADEVEHPAGGWQTKLAFRAPFARLTLAATLALFLVLVSGAAVVASGAAQACSGWPLCQGGLPASPLGWLEMAHRTATLASAVLMAAMFASAWRTQRSQRVILTAATGAFLLFAGQVLVGAAKVSRSFPTDLIGLHAASAAALWAVQAVLVTAVGMAGRDAVHEEQAQTAPARQRAKDFLLLNKPVIVVLLLVTTYAGLVLGGRRLPEFELTFWTMLGGALAAGGASALNQYIDRNLDRNMQRTAKRPLPSGRLTPAEGLAYGLGACLAAFFLLAVFVNLLAALLSLAGMVYYVLLYSIWLKKLTVQNIVIGGGAGAIPPLVGWAAASGSLNIPSLFLFAIVFLWTPPHFWALALVRRNDYARAGVPMLPVVKGEKAARWQILIYTLQLVGLTLLMPAFHLTGLIFLFSALGLGAWLISAAWRVWKNGGNKTAWKMYRYSSMYLAFLFLALVIDVLV